jgi:hypothetical protein
MPVTLIPVWLVEPGLPPFAVIEDRPLLQRGNGVALDRLHRLMRFHRREIARCGDDVWH